MLKEKTKRQKRVDLICILTGEILLKQPRARVEKQAKKLKFDNTEDYIKYYVCKNSRNLLAKGFTELEIRQRYKCTETKTIPFNILKCYVKKFKTKDAVDRKRQRKVADDYRKQPIIVKWKRSEPISLLKNKAVCEKVTEFACWRPDIYLDYGCSECILKDNCACPIKNLKRKPHAKGIKKFKSI